MFYGAGSDDPARAMTMLGYPVNHAEKRNVVTARKAWPTAGARSGGSRAAPLVVRTVALKQLLVYD
jgi:hypothetical protein